MDMRLYFTEKGIVLKGVLKQSEEPLEFNGFLHADQLFQIF
jgi:hypothetical protein